MKASQTLLLIVVLVGLIGGVTFVRNWMTTKTSEGGTEPANAVSAALELEFPAGQIAGDVQEYELNVHGNHDFYFRNPNANGVEVGVETKSCKCAKVEALVLAPEEEKHIQAQIQQWADYQREARSSFYPDVSRLAAPDTEIRQMLAKQPERWHLLESSEGHHETFVLPEKCTGFFRLTWQGRNLGPVSHGAKLWRQLPGDPRTRLPEGVDLRVPLVVVQPVRIHPPSVQLPYELTPNQHYTFDVLCWTGTRPTFKLSAKEENDDPCFVTTITPLTGGALQRAAELLEKEAKARQVRCAYRVGVTIYERLPNNAKQLDLGLLQRKIILTTDQEDVTPLDVSVHGVVRGDINVGTDDPRDKDMIVMKTFLASKGQEVTVPVESNQPKMELTIARKKPDYLKVQLVERPDAASPGMKRWDLKVQVPPGHPAGKLENFAVVLQINSQPPRYIRIPVVGRATTH